MITVEDKVKSKSLEDENGVDYYEKIADKPFPEENLIDFAQEISQLPPNNFDCLNNQIIVPSKREGMIDEIKLTVKKINTEIVSFKNLFTEYICDESFPLDHCEIRASDTYIDVYADKFFSETLLKVDTLTHNWSVMDGNGFYALVLRIELEDML